MQNLIFACLLGGIAAELQTPQFANPIYPEYGYNGSRVLETNYSSNVYADFNWTQTATLYADGTVWMVDTANHVVVKMPPTSSLAGFPVVGDVFAGVSGRPGYNDGSTDVSLFNSPTGIGILELNTDFYIIVVDTGNHCIRAIDPSSKSVFTYAGVCGTPGKQDGDGRKALFRYPASIGVNSDLGAIAILDNGGFTRIVLRNRLTGMVDVETLVQGACRSLSNTTLWSTIVTRQVRCQTNWLITAPGSTETIDKWNWPTVCLGNSVTCSDRYSFT
jgi:hypothetical protein